VVYHHLDIISLFTQGECAKVSSVNDKSDWKTVRKALSVIEFSESNIEVSPNRSTLPKHYHQILKGEQNISFVIKKNISVMTSVFSCP
jgi:hypothetical protein